MIKHCRKCKKPIERKKGESAYDYRFRQFHKECRINNFNNNL